MAGEHRSSLRKDIKMGRSKFPGKPTKISSKRRVNLSSCQLPHHNELSQAAENICRGLSVFNQTFGDSKLIKCKPFTGFSGYQIEEAMADARLQQKEAEAEFHKQGVASNFYTDFQKELSCIHKDLPTKFSKLDKNTNMCFDGGGVSARNTSQKRQLKTSSDEILQKRQTRAVKVEIKEESIVTPSKRKLVMNSSLPKSLESQAAKRLLQKAKKVHVSESNKPSLEKKFVLPTRSAHSSRVIKPNKRFLQDEKSTKKDAVPVVPSSPPAATQQPAAVLSSPTARPNGKIILREARLQLESTPRSLGDGPFSSPSVSGLATSPQRMTTIACGVCGAVRFYKFVKQVRKFGILSCEPCRKFISKIVRRRSSLSDGGVKCLKGTGLCMVPAVVRNAQWRSSGTGCSSRCQACWLKLCLRTYQIPSNLKQSLQLLLPVEMRTDSLPRLADSKLFPVSDNSISLFKSFTGVADKRITNDTNSLKAKATEDKSKKERRKVKSEKKRMESKTNNRQRIPIQGPRVKHVCRSASVVLGQPIATFSDVQSDKQECCDDGIAAKEEKSVEPPPDAKQIQPIEQIEQKAPKAVPAKPLGPLQVRKKKVDPAPAENLLSMDFWENYDPDEVCDTGFSLIGSDTFSARALCYLCGSAGLEKLVHCASCCEPYHEFCVSDLHARSSGWKLDWVCPRCTICATCSRPSGQQLKCVRCDNSYHTECVGGRLLHSPDRPWVCSACLRCKSCNAVDVSVFVGNLPLCKPCFVLRQKGNFCPLCQRCYADDDYDCKMMECGGCKSWVHAKCEGVSDEKYQVLSFLPESVEFICRMCCAMPPAPWWLAVEAELRAGYMGVLKALSKNRVACRMLRWSPRKVCSCRRRDSVRMSPDHDSIDSTRRDSPAPTVDSGIGSPEDDSRPHSEEGECFCFLEVDSYNSRSKPFSPNLLTIKKKVTTNEYSSLLQFHEDMRSMIETAQSDELLEVYHAAVKEVFPWFDSRFARVLGSSRGGSLENTPIKSSPMKPVSPVKSLVPIGSFEGKPIDYFYNDVTVEDTRICLLCKVVGDGPPDWTGRLLYCGQNDWVHCNCALWSGEVFEEIDGSLQNVHSAISRGRGIRCPRCEMKGASVGCCARSCPETFHFACARQLGCIFLDDKSVYCPSHVGETVGRLLQNEKDFEMRRPVYVELDKRRTKPVDVAAVRLMVGALKVEALGRFVPQLSDLSQTLMPAEFCASRLFWSSREPWRLVQYRFTVRCVEPEQSEGVDLGVNITVDHSRSDLEPRLKQLRHFQLHHTLIPLDIPLPAKRIKRRIFDPLDEPDNQDLLPPEIEEAILKELSHDMIEGISVQDIFQDMSERERDDDEDDLAPHIRPRKTGTLRSGNWNAKQGKSDPKWKRKTQEGKENKMVGWCARLLQVDGTVDSSSGSEAGESPGRSVDMPADIPQLDGASDSDCDIPQLDGVDDSECENCDTDEAPVKCETCRCTYRTQRSFERHLESRCHDLMLSSSEDEEEAPPPPPPPPTTKPRTYARKKAPAVPPAPVPAVSTAPSIIMPSNPVPMILQEVPAYQPMVQYIMEPQKPLIVPNAYQVVLPPSPVVLGTPSPMFEVVTDPHTGGMYLAQPSPQPLLYNVETIVSNTVMQTNQFVSSSFSQTSTQVFQASKLEQVVNMPTSYVISPNDLICVPVNPPVPQTPSIRTQWTPTKPKPVVVKRESPPKPKPLPAPIQAAKIKPRSRALVDYINNFRSDVPDFPMASCENKALVAPLSANVTTPSVTVPVTATPTIHRVPHSNDVRKVHSFPLRITASPLAAKSSEKINPPLRQVSAPPWVRPHEPSPPLALSISMPSLDDSPIQSCDNSPSLPIHKSPTVPPVQISKGPSIELTSFSLSYTSTSLPPPVNSSVSTSLPSVKMSSHLSPRLGSQPVLQHIPLQPLRVSSESLSPKTYSQQTSLPSPHNVYNPPSPFLSSPLTSSQCSPRYSVSHTPPLPSPPKSIAQNPNYQNPSISTLPLPFYSCERTYNSKVSQATSAVQPLPVRQPEVAVDNSICKQQKSTTTLALTQPSLNQQNRPLPSASVTCSPTRAAVSLVSKPSPELPPNPVSNDLAPASPAVPVTPRPLQPRKSPLAPQIPQAKCEPFQTGENKPYLKEVKITPRIVEPEGPKLIYDVVADDGFKFSSTSLSEVWQKICESVQEIRAAYRMVPVPMAPRNHEVLGMNNHGLQHLLEQMPGVGFCKNYQAKYFKQPRTSEEELTPVKENPTGCARSEAFTERKEVDKFGWLASRHRKLPRLNPSSDDAPSNRKTNNLPMAMRYRHLRENNMVDMYVYRSKIHGMGLFSLKEIEAGEMVIEYSGELIRSALTDKREKFYTDKGIGCYMFRIDDNLVVDATMKGSAARFINHSCEPNCYSKVVDISGRKHIIIFALRRIAVMEELTYDYKFPFEDVKISCHCSSKKCRKYLN